MTERPVIDSRLRRLRDEYGSKYGLSYHVPYALHAEDAIGLRGKRVLEVGGALPREFVSAELGVVSWLGIEDADYYEDEGGPPRYLDDAAPLESLTEVPPYLVARGTIEELPATLWGAFDAVFSIAAFEHLNRFPRALDVMYEALRPGGKLFALFAPIWSAQDGHHLRGVTDRSGRKFTYHDGAIPPWGHLLLRPPELYRFLLGVTDPEAAAEIVYNVYHSPCINRLFPEDYVAYFQQSRFKILQLNGVFPVDVPATTLMRLKSRHPGREHFSDNGLLVVMEK